MALPIVVACNVTSDRAPPPAVGQIAADEPEAALAGSALLAAGGNAADAAAASALAMAVTLPSRVGLAGGGVCVVYDPDKKAVRTLDFLPRAPAGGRSETAVPALLRGLYALQAGYGKLRWEQVVVAAEAMARDGVPVSRAFASDLREAGGALGRDAEARRLFLAGGAVAPEGARIAQPELAQILAQVRRQGVGAVVHGGALAPLVAGGLGLEPEDLRGYQPVWRDTIMVPLEHEEIHFANLAGSGSSATADGWRAVVDAPAREWPRSLLDSLGRDPALRAAGVPGAGLAVIDAADQAVACAFTMGAPFGSGRMIPDTGLFAARPASAAGVGGPVVVINHNVTRAQFTGVAVLAGSHQETAGAAPAALVGALMQSVGLGRTASEAQAAPRVAPGPAAGTALVEGAGATALAGVIAGESAGKSAGASGERGGSVRPVPALARVTLIACPLDANGAKRCRAVADPRGAGLGVRAER